MFIPLDTCTDEFSKEAAAFGYCATCGVTHSLPFGAAKFYARQLREQLEIKGDMLLPVPDGVENQREIQAQLDGLAGNPRYSMDYLWGIALGQMLGVMVCKKQDGTIGIVRAFSGQYDRLYEIPGWAPPVMNLVRYNEVYSVGNKVVNEYTERINAVAPSETLLLQQLKRERKVCSRSLMDELYDLYVLENFKGERKTLRDVFYSRHGMRTGTADCCAPKLINYAQQHQLTPLGIAEFFYGTENKSQTRQHGNFYEACEEKCQPILGFMLCGLP
ncbi:hypothetical protein [Halodesulfovibrio marinisediminis]|uniref:Uncharacterized protein n=1 Tax=Halodesulfovibrio marinisediminis DSM 17456 TaxID=1121457 RepID=A0A1N6FCK9_9BACT|nr:hypothetical protein [Halodesulfovibrio marinisediminis]SIN92964.1 hypothetical protein SAMN02745161_1239 [Halodesulfovibrio marinisediminis DSM 17456]